jgi:UDP-glucose:(heptosyl)LPS alpha-1,3-glucosyltransferase
MDRNSTQTHYRAGDGVHAAYLERRMQTESTIKALSLRYNPRHRFLLQLERTAFENPSLRCLFTNSEMVKKEVTRFYPSAEEKVHVVHNGVEFEELKNPFNDTFDKRSEILQTLNLPSSTYHFLFIGNGYRRKGLDFLLEALSTMKDQYWHLSVVGKDKSIGSFQSLAKALNIEEKVSFFGPQSETRSFYQMADALVVPSLYDPFANVTVEALAMGLFVVSSKFNGGNEVLTEQTGAVIEELDNPTALCSALRAALSRPKTRMTGQLIRDSVSSLDFSNKLNQIVSTTLNSL